MKKSKKTALITLFVLNIAVYSAFGAMFAINKAEEKNINQPVYVSNVTTGEITSIKCDFPASGEASFELNKNGDSWTCLSEQDFPLNSEAIAALIEKTQNLTAARMVASNTEDYSQYGLDNPTCQITFTDSEGNSQTYLLGNFNENLNRYYVCEQSKSDIYIINKSIGEQMSSPLYSYAAAFDLSGLSRTTLNSLHILNGENEIDISKFDIDQNSPMGSSSAWRFLKPFSSSTFADTNKIDVLISKLTKSAAAQCVAFNPTDEQLASYGLLSPESSISVNYTVDDAEKQAAMYVGKQNNDGSAYIMFDGSNIVALSDSDTMSNISEYLDSYKYVPQSICAVKKTAIDSMEVSYGGETFIFDFTDNGYTKNSVPCDSESFEAFFNKLSGINSTSHSYEAEGVQPAVNSLIVTYHLKDTSYGDIQAVYTPYNQDYYTASSGETSGRLVNIRTVESVIGLLQNVK